MHSNTLFPALLYACIPADSYLKLGIPTANIPADDLSEKHPDLETGVYYGVVALDPKSYEHENDSKEKESSTLLPAVLSIGYNPFYKNTVRSVVRSIATHSPPEPIYIQPGRIYLGHILTLPGNPCHAPSDISLPNGRRPAEIQPDSRFLRNQA